MALFHVNPNPHPTILRSPGALVVRQPLYYSVPPPPPPPPGCCYCYCYYDPNPSPYYSPLHLPISSLPPPNATSIYHFYYPLPYQGLAMIGRRYDVYGMCTDPVAAAEPESPPEKIKEPIVIEEVKDEADETDTGEERSLPLNSNRPCSGLANRRRRGLKRQCWKRKGGVLEFRAEEASPNQEGDARTTVMLKNLPNKLGKQKLLRLLDEHCRRANEKLQPSTASSEFDFLYLPMDFRTGCNYGYAFVNFTTAAAACRIHGEMHRMSWASHGSTKVCEVTYARIQGLRALLDHFKKSVFVCEDGEYRPSHFVPCRDGVRPVDQRLIGWHVGDKGGGRA